MKTGTGNRTVGMMTLTLCYEKTGVRNNVHTDGNFMLFIGRSFPYTAVDAEQHHMVCTSTAGAKLLQ
eukprot:3814124-Amphidinium_carterae.3